MRFGVLFLMSRLFTVASLVVLIVVVFAAIGVSAYLERQGIRQPTVSDNLTTIAPTATPQPMRTTEVGYTTTPAPDFAAMQRTIDEQVADLNEQRAQFYADIERDALEAATEKAQEEIAQLRRMYDADYTAKLEDLDHQRRMNAETYKVYATLQAGIVAKQVALDLSEIRTAQKLDEWNAIIKATWLTAWRLLGLLTVAAGIVWLFIKTSQMDEQKAELLRMAHTYEDQIRTIHQEVTEKARAEALRYNQIRDYVRDSVRVAGGDYHQFPPASDPGMAHWHNDRRTEVVGYMKADGKVYTDNRGTFVKRGTLAELLDEIERGEYPSPLPHPSPPERTPHLERRWSGTQK